ncbi:ATP synthase F1 subunit gamma [Candidatus Peregrinibacteria bacterium]|nr:ATP synthase F1 subunit gamma [Candidatus Peregrinibacteria bacterium]
MASLIEVRKKIGGVKNTKKITKAMQLVATSKMKLFQRKAISTRNYVWDLLKTLGQNLEAGSESVFTEKRTQGKILFVLYTSDKGLCGALNANMIKTLFRSDRWKETPVHDRLLLTIGKKAYDYAKSSKIKVEKHFTGMPENLKTIDTLPIIDTILTYWMSGEVKEVIFVAPHFHNTFTFYPRLKTYLPFSQEMIETHLGHQKKEMPKEPLNPGYMFYEPSQARVVEYLFEMVTQGMFIQSFFELKASEYSSRMLAMQNATDSADKIIVDLTRVYNKTRQQVITQQLAELIGASEQV